MFVICCLLSVLLFTTCFYHVFYLLKGQAGYTYHQYWGYGRTSQQYMGESLQRKLYSSNYRYLQLVGWVQGIPILCSRVSAAFYYGWRTPYDLYPAFPICCWDGRNTFPGLQDVAFECHYLGGETLKPHRLGGCQQTQCTLQHTCKEPRPYDGSLRNLEDWASAWHLPEMFAGRPGAVATDAWYITAAELEFAQLEGSRYAGGTVDMYKCFNQVNKHLLTKILLLAGFPAHIMATYNQQVL